MTTATPVQEIQEETKCPICLEYLTDPVTINCGHNFCRACIKQYCDTWTAGDYDPLSCPNCRKPIQKGALQYNYQLANIVEKVKHLDVQQGIEDLCEKHSRALDLFCEEDWKAMCVVCWRSPEHRSHKVLLVEEATQKYKEKIQAHLKTLREEKEKLLGFKVTGEKKSQEYLKWTEKERKKIVSEFQQLRQFLEEQEQKLLAQLEKLDKETVETQDENISKLSGEISRVSELISELEGKCQKPANEFLQDIRNILIRYKKEKFQQPKALSPELEKGLSDFSQKTVALMETLKTFKDMLPPSLERTREGSLGSFTQVTVTLDPHTTHPQLVLSKDGKTVRWTDTWWKSPNNPQRFDTEPCVLGREGFTSGRYYWEVEVGDWTHWAVGVARESVRRKGRISPSPEEGIWAVRQWGDQFQALTSTHPPLPPIQLPCRIRVCLDCDQGLVTFFSAGDKAPIFTFPPGSVHGERLLPWLWVSAGSQLRLRP